MTFKELIKSNIPRSILIIGLYILYAITGALENIYSKIHWIIYLKEILMVIFIGHLFKQQWRSEQQFYCQLLQLL